MKSWLNIALVSAVVALPCLADPFVLPDAELLTDDFEHLWGTSTLDGKGDPTGPGVNFSITLDPCDPGKMGIGDPWPTNPAAGLLWDDGLGHYTSLHPYDSYHMTVSYLAGPAGSEIHMALFLNTGLTGPSGDPSNDPNNDTFWGGTWVEVQLGETKTLILDFDAAEAWNISDNPPPHTGGGQGWPDGGTYAINDRDRHEISNIGIQVADFDGDVGGAQIQLGLNLPKPTTLTLQIVHPEWGSVQVEPNLPQYPDPNTIVTLTAEPNQGKRFKRWKLYDPNHPADANYMVSDSNDSITIVMDADRRVTAVFKCGGGGLEGGLPLLVVFGAVGLFALIRRRK